MIARIAPNGCHRTELRAAAVWIFPPPGTARHFPHNNDNRWRTSVLRRGRHRSACPFPGLSSAPVNQSPSRANPTPLARLPPALPTGFRDMIETLALPFPASVQSPPPSGRIELFQGCAARWVDGSNRHLLVNSRSPRVTRAGALDRLGGTRRSSKVLL